MDDGWYEGEQPVDNWNTLSFVQSNRHRGDIRAALRPDRDRLPVALSPHIEVSRKATARDTRDDFRSAGMAGNTSRHTAGGFAPGAGKRAAFGNDVAANFQPVTVARTAQRLLDSVPSSIDGVVCLAANPLGDPARHCDRAGPRPVPRPPEEGTR